MRTSITLDEAAYELASLYARGRGITLSAAINEAVLRIGEPRSASDSSRIKTLPNGRKVFAANGRVITPEMIKQAEEEDDFAQSEVSGRPECIDGPDR